MNTLSPDQMREATRLTKAGRLGEAVATLQRMLGRGAPPDEPSSSGRWESRRNADVAVNDSPRTKSPLKSVWLTAPGDRGLGSGMPRGEPEPRVCPPGAPEKFSGRRSRFTGRRGFDRLPIAGRPIVPDGARFLDRIFSSPIGSRPYKLYVPSGYRGDPVPLIVMLHGCTQSPEDFAAGTRMNDAAETHTCIVAYPGQTPSANMQKCWNWYKQGDQRRGAGEPALIAGITREVMDGYAIDPRRTFVAGLSAGGAAAAVMGEAYPDLYAAIGVHSGLACGVARDMPSALAAMRQGGGARAHRAPGGAEDRTRLRVPAIVFHGERDAIVNPRNGAEVVARSAQGAALSQLTREGRVPGGHAYTVTTFVDARGESVIEQWVIHGAGHAWFGGSPTGSYTDPRGPDATEAMLAFFLDHPHPEPGRSI